MRNIYIEPKTNIFKLDMESLLSGSGVPEDAQGPDGGTAKEHNFSSFDCGFDEEEDKESNSSRKSLWD